MFPLTRRTYDRPVRRRSAHIPARTRAKRSPILESLEERTLLSIFNPVAFVPPFSPTGNPMISAPVFSSPRGPSPAQIRHAYQADNVTFAGGIQGNGAGQTIAIIAGGIQPNIASDLHNFDLAFGLPDPPSFQQNWQPGTTNDQNGDPWGPEETMDVEWSHVMAPAANIVVESWDDNRSSFFWAVDNARNLPGVSVVSMSLAMPESGLNQLYETLFDSLFTTPAGHTPVTFVASSGDTGGTVWYPAASPNVLGVGGTILTTGAGNVWSSEVGWDGSGGGVSQYESQPSYQNGVVSAYSTTKRTVPDVSMSAGAVPVYDSWDNGTQTPWTLNGRTSLSAPCWAGIIAVADQGATLLGKGTLSTNQVQTKLYNLYQSGLYQTAFHDIIASDYVSTNTYSPRPGYDLSTGLGSPRVDAIVAALSGNYGNTPMLVNEQRLFAGKGRQRTLVFQLDFSTALNAAVARKTGHYSVVQDIRAAAQYRPAQTKRIPVRAAKYKPGNNSVTLTLGRYTALNELQLTATGLIGATGTPAGTIVTKL